MTDALLALADLDQEVLRAQHAVAHPPSAQAFDAATAALDALRTAKRELDVARTPLVERAASLERDAAAARERASAIGARLEAATGAGRELEAMAHERDVLLARAVQLEDEQLELLEALEPLDVRDAELRAAATTARDRAAAAAASAAEERADATSTLEGLDAERPSLAASVEPSLLARYDAVAARSGGVGAARLIDGRCGACRVSVPSALLDQLQHALDPAFVVPCDECGRLLAR